MFNWVMKSKILNLRKELNMRTDEDHDFLWRIFGPEEALRHIESSSNFQNYRIWEAEVHGVSATVQHTWLN